MLVYAPVGQVWESIMVGENKTIELPSGKERKTE